MTHSTQKKMTGYCLLVGAYLALAWTLPFFPTQDGPSHVYNLAILHDLVNGGRQWGGVFSYQLSAIPNLGFHIVAYPLLAFVSPLIAERIFISIYLVAMAAAVPFLLRSFDKAPLPLSYLALPVLFNAPFMMGFYSYAIAIPLFLAALCLAWQTRHRPLWLRFLCVNLSGAAIYLFHMVALLMYIASLVAIMASSRSSWKGGTFFYAREIAVLSPLLASVALFAVSSGNAATGGLSYLLSPDRAFGLAIDLLSFSTVSYWTWQIVPAAVLMFLVVLFGLAAVRDARQRRARGERFAPAQKALFLLALMLIAVYFLAPSRFGEGGFFNKRFPWVILLLLLPLLEVPDTPFFKRFGTAALAGCAWLFLGVNAVVLGEQSGEVEKFVNGIGTGPPANACLLTVKRRTRQPRIDPLLHASSHYGLRNGCVDIGNYEVGVPFFPVRFRSDFPATPSLVEIERHPWDIRWSSYPYIQYLLAWQMDGSETRGLRKEFSVYRRNGDLTLWKRK